jgi:hypothetical protein
MRGILLSDGWYGDDLGSVSRHGPMPDLTPDHGPEIATVAVFEMTQT